MMRYFETLNAKVIGLERSIFPINKDGYLKGGVEVKIPEEIPTKNKVGGQRRMRPEKKSEVEWW